MHATQHSRPQASQDGPKVCPEKTRKLSLGHYGQPISPAAAPRLSRRTRRLLHYVLPLLTVMLAFALRVYRLPDVPFGWHPDEASKGLLARDVLAGKYAPAFFGAFTGRDALYVYLEAACFALFGEGMFAGRLLSAFIGVLTVAATFAVGRVLFTRRTALLGAALLSASLWHIIASRNSYRAVIQPLVQIPVLWLLFREWHTAPAGGSRWAHGAVAGFFLGLTQYTYTAARAFPVMLLLLLGLTWVLARSLIRRSRHWLLAMLLTAILVSVPLGVYFYRHPFDLYGRATQVSVFAPEWSGGDAWTRLRRSVVETVLMFSAWGDPNYRFNIAGRPVFGPVGAIAFYGGLLVSVWHAVRCRGLRQLACIAVIVWLIVMLLPMTLSAESLPYFQRAIGILPAVYLVPALFTDRLLVWISSLAARVRRSSPRGSRLARLVGEALAGVLIAVLTWYTARAYFADWHTTPRNDDDRRVAMVYGAQYLAVQGGGLPLYLSSEYPEHPTLAFLAPEQYDDVAWFDARQSLPLPPPGVDATYLLLVENPPQPILLQRVPDLQRVHREVDRFGRPVFDVYQWDGGAFPVPADLSPAVWSFEVTYEPGDPEGLRHAIDLPVNFGDVLSFAGHDRSASAVAPGDTLDLVLYWHLLRRPERHYSMFAHLLDRESRVVAEYDANRYPTTFWREDGGEMLLSHFALYIAPGTPAGEYRLEIGVYHQPTGERLAVYDGTAPVADRLLLNPVVVQ